MTYPYGRDEWLARAAAISAREYLFGYLSRHIPSEAIHALRERSAEAKMVGAVLDGDSVKVAMDRPHERTQQLEAKFMNKNPFLDEAERALEKAEYHWLTVAIQHLNSSPYNLTKDECIAILRELRDGVKA